jgi:hypothetical protein
MVLEINSCKNYEVLEVRQGDKKSRIIDFTFTVNGEIITLTSAMTAKVNATVDNVIVAEDVAAAVDTENNVVTVTLTDTMLALSGLCKMDIVLTEGNEIITAETICLRIGKKVINDDSKPYEGAGSIAELAKEIEAARGTQPNLNERFVANETNLENKANTADVETVKSEITSARGEYDNLGQRLDTLISGNEQGQVDTFNLAEGAVTAEIIADRAITLSKLSIELLAMLNTINNKADKATTLDGYGITDAYTKDKIKSLLAGKLDAMSFDSEPKLNSPCYLTSGTVYNALLAKADKNAVDTALTSKANLVNSLNIFDFDAWAKELQKLNQPVYHGTLDELNFDEKSITFTATEKDAYTNSWMLPKAESMKISVKPNTKYWMSWLANNYNCNALVFLNGIHTDGTFVTIKNGKGTFVTNNDTSFITIRFGSYNYGTFKISEIMITEKESIYLPNKVAEGVTEVADEVFAFEKTTQTSLDKKYDSSNVENGKGTLTPAQAIYDGFEGSFNYSKIGKTVTVALNITTLIAGKNYVQFAGLPFKAMTASKLSSIAVYTTNNKLVNLRLDGTLLYVSSPGTTFADGEKINAIITYIIG